MNTETKKSRPRRANGFQSESKDLRNGRADGVGFSASPSSKVDEAQHLSSDRIIFYSAFNSIQVLVDWVRPTHTGENHLVFRVC